MPNAFPRSALATKLPTGVEFRFVGRLCLDLVATQNWAEPKEEALVAEADLAHWLQCCSLGLPKIPIRGEHVDKAQRLRESLWWGIQARMDYRIPGSRHIRHLNELAAESPLQPELDHSTSFWVWKNPQPLAALSNIARDGISLLATPGQLEKVRTCAAPDCNRLFLDDSRAGKRRWCSPTGCGDRLRARAYRKRKKDAAQP